MKSIAVMVASSTDFTNTGMFSVDYSGYLFFKGRYPDCDFKIYVAHLGDESKYPYEELMPYETYNLITSENVRDIQNSDLIVYWGDFFTQDYSLKNT